MPQKSMFKVLLACGIRLVPQYDVIAWVCMAAQLISSIDIIKSDVKHFWKTVYFISKGNSPRFSTKV